MSYNNEPSLTASFHSGLAIIRRSSEAREGFGKSAKIAIPADTSNIQHTRIVGHTEGAKEGRKKKGRKKKERRQGGSWQQRTSSEERQWPDPSTAPYDTCGTSRQDEALRLSARRFGTMEEDAPSKAMLDKEREERIR